MTVEGTTLVGPEVLVPLRRDAGRPLRAQLEDGLREGIRAGRLAQGARLPSSRVLARDLRVSRRLVVEVYAQLLAEGYVVARRGSGTRVAEGIASDPPAAAVRPDRPPRFDFFPGHPDLATFPRSTWSRVWRDALREAPDRALGYPDPRGDRTLREALAAYLSRARGLTAGPDRIVLCTGAIQALALVGATAGGRMAIEDPYLPPHRAALAAATGHPPVPVPVDARGLRVETLERAEVAGVLVTPAHQCTFGVELSAERRATLLRWARAGGLVVEDDYDAEYRYDRTPVGALQGLAPEAVAYIGSASKTLAPALRIAWLVLPERLVAPVLERKVLADMGSPVLEQRALARFISGGHYDRHLRQSRRRYGARRVALEVALADHLPGAKLGGMAAGLHGVVTLPGPARDAGALVREARRRSVGIYPVGLAYAEPRERTCDLALGYACLPEPSIDEGVRRLAEAVRAVPAA